MAPSTSPSPELLAYREARARWVDLFTSYDDDRLDLMCEARAVCVRLSGRNDLPKVPPHVAGEMVSTSVLSDRSAVWLSAVPPVNQPDAQAVWSTIKTRLTALADALYSARSAAEHAARLVRDVLADETDETKWRCVKQRRSDGSCDARSSATYDADDLLVLGYSAAVVHRYHGGNRRTFEVWARCTEEGSNVAPRQRPDTVSKCLWHQLHVPLVDVEGDDEPDIALIEVRLTRCLVLRQRDAERFAGAARVP